MLTACSKQDEVIGVADDDTEMTAAIAEARETLPQFWQVFDKPEGGESDFALKVKIADERASELADAQAGYHYYGLEGVASLQSCARRMFENGDELGDHEQQLDREYATIIPSNSSLVERFEKRLNSNPLEYALRRSKDMG